MNTRSMSSNFMVFAAALMTWAGSISAVNASTVDSVERLDVHSANQNLSQPSEETPKASRLPTIINSINKDERLDAWLRRSLKDQSTAYADSAALFFTLPGRVNEQENLKRGLLSQLAGRENGLKRYEFLLHWIDEHPVTGRVVMGITDPDWLLLNPKQNPVLNGSETLVLPSHSSTVSVLIGSIKECTVEFKSGRLVADYVKSCYPNVKASYAWVVEPNGRYFKVGLQNWNLNQVQEQPFSGARVWVPEVTSDQKQLRSKANRLKAIGFDDSYSDAMAKFLATQPPSGASAIIVSDEHFNSVVGAPDRRVGSIDDDSKNAGNELHSNDSSSVKVDKNWAGISDSVVALTEPPIEERPTRLTTNDWGEVGLLQTPSARSYDAGNLTVDYSLVQPYTRVTLMGQPFEWLSFGIRYSSLSNAKYGTNISTESFKDKSSDIRFRLAKETNTRPEISLGLRDVAGTGLFSSEYLVGSKRLGDFDLSLGIGWGYIAGRGDLKNPFSLLLGSSYNQRVNNNEGNGGTVSTAYFKGPAALFGGVEWQSPLQNLSVKMEFDGNNYRNEPFQSTYTTQKSPINLGINYQVTDGYQLALGFERGNTLMIGFSSNVNFSQSNMPKIDNPAPPALVLSERTDNPHWEQTVKDIELMTGWHVLKIAEADHKLEVVVSNTNAYYRQERIERALLVLQRDAPQSVSTFVLTFEQRGAELVSQVIDRQAWINEHLKPISPEEREAIQQETLPIVARGLKAPKRTEVSDLTAINIPLQSKEPDGNPTSSEAWWDKPENQIDVWKSTGLYHKFGIGPSYSQIIGGPDHFIQYQAGVAGDGEVRLTESTWISGKVDYRLIDNYHNFVFDGPSLLPRVRTDIRSYVESNRFTIPNLQINHVTQLSDTQFVSVYAGLLEMMYAGVGGEWLYRPLNSPLMFGVNVNRVQQRGFDQRFDLRSYKVTEGHAAVYWDTGWNGVQVKLDYGQYLAGDRGATIDLSRRFENGLTMGLYASKTNVSAAQFGEGSFDKGVYFKLPFDAVMTKDSDSLIDILWQPLTRDGAARLKTTLHLADETADRDRMAFKFRSFVKKDTYRNVDLDGLTLPIGWSSASHDFDSAWDDLRFTANGVADRMFSTDALWAWALAGTAFVASSALDKPVDRWALKHQGSASNSAGKLLSEIPIALELFAHGALLVTPEDDLLSDTAWASVKSSFIVLGSNLLIKESVGRARPEQDLGNRSFSPFGPGVNGSSFMSNHMVTAFAIVTPFAERYDAPWLYALAGATGIGRIQQRQHWFSDVVAGSLFGYAVGLSVIDQHNETIKAGQPRLSITPNSIGVNVSF